MNELPSRDTPYAVIYAEGDSLPSYGSLSAYGHVKMRLRNFVRTEYRNLGEIIVSCQASDGELQQGKVYALRCEYVVECISADAHELEAAAKVLKTLSRKLQAIADEYGFPQTFTEYALRVLKVAKIEQVYIRPGVNEVSGIKRIPDYPHFRMPGDRSQIRYEIAELERQIIMRYAPVKEAA
jgi:hypothetical protein